MDELERENAALREQLAERDAELAAIKGHAEAMADAIAVMKKRDLKGWLPEAALTSHHWYRAAYPKE